MAAMVADCYWGGLVDQTEAMWILAEVAGIDPARAANLLLSVPARPGRDDDGSWTR